MLLGLVLVLSGCSIPPMQYNLPASGDFPEIEKKQNIPDIEVVDFKYEPPIKISQHTISLINCYWCQADGSTQGTVFAKPLDEIIQAELSNALEEVVISNQESSCSLAGTLHLAGWDYMNGDTTLDMTLVLMKEEQIKFVKRVRGFNDRGFFEFSNQGGLFTLATRNAVSLLVTDNDFLNEVEKSCTVSSL